MCDHKFSGTGHEAVHSIAGSYRWRRRGALLALVFFTASAVAAADSADPKRYLEDIKALTTPAMAGRGDGDPGLTLAANMIERRFRALGLQPAGKNSYLQPFTVVTGAKLKENNRLEILNGGAKKGLKLNEDFEPFSFSSSGEISGPVVFAGYGASATEFGYDDYAHLDVKDKIVVVLRNEPATFTAKSGNQGETAHPSFITKAINARNRGAKAIIFVNGKMAAGEEDLLLRFGSASGPADAGILILQVKSAVADQWLRAAGKSLAEIQEQINTSGKPSSLALPADLHLSLAVNIEHTKATER